MKTASKACNFVAKKKIWETFLMLLYSEIFVFMNFFVFRERLVFKIQWSISGLIGVV